MWTVISHMYKKDIDKKIKEVHKEDGRKEGKVWRDTFRI